MLLFQEISHKKIAIGLYGISYRSNYNHWMGWKTNVDYRSTNYQDSLLKVLRENNNTIDHYFSTYNSELNSNILQTFSPKKYLFNNFQDNTKDKSWVIHRHNRFKETINLFEPGYDYYIVTRFDLSFNENILKDCKVQQDTINVTSKHGIGNDHDLICDYFYIFSCSMLERFRDFINNLQPPEDIMDIGYYHKLHRYPNSPPFSFLMDGVYFSHNCPLWRIIRNK